MTMHHFILLAVCSALFFFFTPPDKGLRFRFKNRDVVLLYPMRAANWGFLPRARAGNARLDTMSNYFSPQKRYVEIVRQDDPAHPTLGLALGFEFDETNGEYPYTPAHAVIQLKDFGWGGPEFGLRDTANYTGVSNAVSNDLSIEIDSFQNETLYGHFSGLLLSGAETMTPLEGGQFAIRVYRVKE